MFDIQHYKEQIGLFVNKFISKLYANANRMPLYKTSFLMLRNLSLVVAIPLLISSCSLLAYGPVEGEFAWAATDDRNIEEPEKSILITTDYKFDRDRIYFTDYQTIHWIYKISGGRFEASKFLAILYENNNTPEPVERDLRHVSIERTDAGIFIRQTYAPLEVGRYILKIANNSMVVDEVEFQVVPPDGPHKDGSENDLYDTPFDQKEDEIVKYSSPVVR